MVSWTAAIASLLYFFLIFHLHKIAALEKFVDLLLRQAQYVPCCLQKIIVRYPPDFPCPGRAILCLMTPPPRSASTCPFLRAHSIHQRRPADLFVSCKALKPSRLEDF